MKDEVANRVSLFFATPTPMMKTVVDSTTKFLQEDRSVSITTLSEVLSAFANICAGMVERNRGENEESTLFTLRTMVGAIILYDHITEFGAFHKRSTILTRKCIQLLKRHQPTQNALLNSLRYTTKHLTDKDTPAIFHQLLAD